MKLSCVAVLLTLAFSLVGCHHSDKPADVAESHKDECKAFTKKFAEAMLKGDWAAAQGMGTKTFQAENTAAQLKAKYDDLTKDILKVSPDYKANTVQADSGDLPSGIADAKDTYSIKNPPPVTTWRGWNFAIVGEGKPDEIERGIEAMILIVEENGQLKVASAEFAFPS